MTASVPTVTALPASRAEGCPFDPPKELADAARVSPISRYTFPDGHEGWLITGHALAREVMSDPRFSSRQELMHHPTIDLGGAEIPPAPLGEITGIDDPEHARYRKLLAGKFTVRRMRQLTERVEQVTAEHLDAMEVLGPPAELVTAFAQPIPAVMICELLGVPYADRASFQQHVATVFGTDASPEEQYVAYDAVQEYIGELVAAKRVKPTDDVLGDLTDSGLSDEELSGLGALLLGAGLDTTANMLALGTFALLDHPEQLAVLRSDPSAVDGVVEELMRYLSIAKTLARVALSDVELGGQLVKAGTTVVLSLNTANRDPERFEDPNRLDVRRHATGHLGFGHGVHQCLGQQLARVEMRVAFPALFQRFPTLRLAEPADEVQLRPETADIHGVNRLLVTWDA